MARAARTVSTAVIAMLFALAAGAAACTHDLAGKAELCDGQSRGYMVKTLQEFRSKALAAFMAGR